MSRHNFPLRSLSAALVFSTALTAPALAVDVTIPAGPLTGMQSYGAVDLFTSAADLTSAHSGFTFVGPVGTATNAGTITVDGIGIDFQTAVGGFVNAGDIVALSDAGVWFSGSVGWARNTGTVHAGAAAYAFMESVESFRNSGSIISDWNSAVFFTGPIEQFRNEQGGSVTGGYRGVTIDGAAGSFFNAGTISGGTGEGVAFSGVVTAFENTGTIRSVSGDGVSAVGTVGAFTNHAGAKIITSTGKAVDFDGAVTAFVNNGLIESGYRGVDLDSPTGSLVNTGTIKAGNNYAIDAESNAIDSFSNSGLIESTGYGAMQMGAVGAFLNSGRITGANEDGVVIHGSVGSFTNSGTISTSGIASSGLGASAVYIGQPLTGTFINTGTIESSDGWGVSIRPSRLVNTGTIRGTTGINADGDPDVATTIVNSGTIQGTGGTAIYFGDNDTDDTVEVLTGSRILGTMGFSHGNDTLNISGFRGNAVMTVAHLENVVTGSTLVSQQLDGTGTGTISVIDATGITSGGSTVMGEIAGAIGGEIAGALGGMTGSAPAPEPMGYAPARPVGAAEAATDELLATQQPTGPEVWGKVFGGVTGKANEYGAALGGIVAGSHVSVDASTRLGGVVSVSGSRFATVGNGQVVASTIGALGLYGSTHLDGPVLSYSVLGGVATNHSDRTVTVMVTETARADFASWFWSPELGLSIPILVLDGVETSGGVKLRYIGGGVGAYTETGSSQNLSVGSSSLNLLDARAELTSKAVVAGNDFGDVTLSATGGLLALHNFGSSVTIAGFPLATTPASFAYGVYGDVTLQGPIGLSATASASAGAELRSDGVATASANMGLSATF